MPELPSVEELKQLPLRAIVAYATRCARRVVPLFEFAELKPRHKKDLKYAILVAEEFARGETNAEFSDSVRSDALSAAVHYADLSAAVNAARAAADAAYAAVNAARADAAYAAYAARAAADAAYAAVYTTAARAAADAAYAAVYTDFKSLINLRLGRYPELGEPIDPSEKGPLGPLWPDGEPDFVKHLRDQDENTGRASTRPQGPPPECLALEAEVNEFANPEEVGEALANLCYALNAYHIAVGGNGLELDGWEILIPESIPVEAS
jgi:hypothetical protein